MEFNELLQTAKDAKNLLHEKSSDEVDIICASRYGQDAADCVQQLKQKIVEGIISSSKTRILSVDISPMNMARIDDFANMSFFVGEVEVQMTFSASCDALDFMTGCYELEKYLAKSQRYDGISFQGMGLESGSKDLLTLRYGTNGQIPMSYELKWKMQLNSHHSFGKKILQSAMRRFKTSVRL